LVLCAGEHDRRGLLGAAVKGRRDDVVLVTKWGNVLDEEDRQLTGVDASPACVRRALDASLRRLDTDWIDVYLLHIADLPIDEAAALTTTLDGLVGQGKIRAYGWSSDDVERVVSWARPSRCAATEFELNVLNDAPALVVMCDAEGLLGLCRGPLAMGLLGGAWADTQVGARNVRGAMTASQMRQIDGVSRRPLRRPPVRGPRVTARLARHDLK